MILETSLQRKPSPMEIQRCLVVGTEYVSDGMFRSLKEGTISDCAFLEKWAGKLHGRPDGLVNCLLVLTDKADDGILIDSEGYNYPRYAAFISGAKLLNAMDWHPSMYEFIHGMTQLVEQYAKLAVDCQCDGVYSLHYKDLQAAAKLNYFNEDFFMEMLSNRPEIELIETDYESYFITIAPEFKTEIDESSYKVLSQEDVDIICAKHFLFDHDSGGEEADFSGCLLKDLDLHAKQLNGASLKGARLVNCNLEDCGFCFSDMTGAQFFQCRCGGLTAEEALLSDAQFISSDFHGAYFTHSDCSKMKIRDCNLSEASFQNCCVDGTDFGEAELDEQQKRGCMEDRDDWEQTDNYGFQPVQ